jgi:hypothetical protein
MGVSTICGGVTLCFSSGNTGVVICSVGVAGLKAGRLTLSVGNAGKIIDSSRLKALSQQSKGLRCISDVLNAEMILLSDVVDNLIGLMVTLKLEKFIRYAASSLQLSVQEQQKTWKSKSLEAQTGKRPFKPEWSGILL